MPPTGDPLNFTTLACPCSIWPASPTPTNAALSDGRPIEVGVKFRTEVNGYITGLRFYKGVNNTGTHIGHLWTQAGVQLTEATFTNETASGWQVVTLPTPIPVLANTTYTASYYSDSGYFAFDASYFATTGVDSPPLHALASGVDGPNGVYRYETPGFPIQGTTNNYWVDVVFDTTDQNAYTLTVVSAHGTVAKVPDQVTYHYGDTVQLTATPAAGWSFANWTGDATGTTNPLSVLINGNKTVTANFTAQPTSKLGGVNGDGVVNSTDALIILSADVGINTSQYCPMNCGDVNGMELSIRPMP